MREIVVIAGPTAVGKTKYSIDYALKNNGEIVSCDSMQLYKYMAIGTAKPTEEELSQVKHHLVDIIDPREEFSVAMYSKLAKAAIEEIFSRGKTPVISGGTGLYLNSIIYDMDFGATTRDMEYRKSLEKIAEEKGNLYVHNLLREKDAEAADRIEVNNLRRVIRALEAVELSGEKLKSFDQVTMKTKDYSVKLIGLTRDRAILYERINQRVDQMLEEGLIDEVRSLLDQGFTGDNIAMKGIGYKEIIAYLEGEYEIDRAIELVKRNTRRYAKRQLTWFRRYDEMEWISLDERSEVTQ